MDDTERKALALSIEVREDARMRLCPDPTLIFGNWEALCRAIEQHEAFRQEVSDAVEHFKRCYPGYQHASLFDRFIIAKPDPLVEALEEASGTNDPVEWANRFYAAIEKRGGKIVWGEG